MTSPRRRFFFPQIAQLERQKKKEDRRFGDLNDEIGEHRQTISGLRQQVPCAYVVPPSTSPCSQPFCLGVSRRRGLMCAFCRQASGVHQPLALGGGVRGTHAMREHPQPARSQTQPGDKLEQPRTNTESTRNQPGAVTVRAFDTDVC